MATDLHQRAVDQRARFDVLVAALRADLQRARSELDRRVPDPATVVVADWPTVFGAVQHLRVARAAVVASAMAEAATRAGLAGVTTPAEAGPRGAELRDVMIAEAGLRVQVRVAEERVATASALVTSLGALVDTAAVAAAGAGDRVVWGAGQQEQADRLRSALATEPLDTVVADAAAALSGPAFADADDRLDELLPDELRARAEARFDESAARLADRVAAVHALAPTTDGRAASAHPLAAAVNAARRRWTAAVDALATYVAQSAGRLHAAEEALVRCAAHPALTPGQGAALDPAGRTDAITALGDEAALAAAVAARDAAVRDLDDATAAAVDARPDDDPDADPAVVAARDVLEGAAIQDPLDTAREAYDAAARRTVDEWEVEVPASLWDATVAFLRARRDLQRLADPTARDDLVTELDDASDELATALDEQDVAWRGDLHLARIHAERAALAGALAAVEAARADSYTRGDAVAGRAPGEL